MLEQERIQLGTDEVVDRHDIETRGALDDSLQSLPTDTAEAVDSDTDGHLTISSTRFSNALALIVTSRG